MKGGNDDQNKNPALGSSQGGSGEELQARHTYQPKNRRKLRKEAEELADGIQELIKALTAPLVKTAAHVHKIAEELEESAERLPESQKRFDHNNFPKEPIVSPQFKKESVRSDVDQPDLSTKRDDFGRPSEAPETIPAKNARLNPLLEERERQRKHALETKDSLTPEEKARQEREEKDYRPMKGKSLHQE